MAAPVVPDFCANCVSDNLVLKYDKCLKSAECRCGHCKERVHLLLLCFFGPVQSSWEDFLESSKFMDELTELVVCSCSLRVKLSIDGCVGEWGPN